MLHRGCFDITSGCGEVHLLYFVTHRSSRLYDTNHFCLNIPLVPGNMLRDHSEFKSFYRVLPTLCSTISNNFIATPLFLEYVNSWNKCGNGVVSLR